MSEWKNKTNLIKDSVKKLYQARKEKEEFDKYFEEVKKKETLIISNFMFSNLEKGESSFEIKLDEGVAFYENPKTLKVTRVRTKKVIWVLENLKQKLGKELSKEVINKTYTINDMKGLTKYLQQCGVDPKKFKKFIDVEETVNEKKLDNYYQTGQLLKKGIKNLDGCYEVKLGEPYIKFKEME